LSVCACSTPTPAGPRAPDRYSAAAWPWVIEQPRLPRGDFRRSLAWLPDSLFTLRRTGYPVSTQNSLPAVGQTLLGGLCTRKVPTEGFRVLVSSHPPSPSLLGAIDETDARNVPSWWTLSICSLPTRSPRSPRRLQGPNACSCSQTLCPTPAMPAAKRWYAAEDRDPLSVLRTGRPKLPASHEWFGGLRLPRAQLDWQDGNNLLAGLVVDFGHRIPPSCTHFHRGGAS